MKKTSPTLVSIALSNEVVNTALKVALLVGSILALINHGTAIIHATLSTTNIYQIILTYLVPYCVSTYSSVKAIQKRTQTIQ